MIEARTRTEIRQLGLMPYRAAYDAMRRYTDTRGADTADELWVLEHEPVYTVGPGGRPEHFPRDGSIEVLKVDRGGQITYHGPGQAIVYALVDLARRDMKVRQMVALIEEAVIELLGAYNVPAKRRPGAPGVYVGDAKIAALGLRVRRGSCYHGVALNVDMDLAPFHAIDPCGYPGLAVTQTSALGIPGSATQLGVALAARLSDLLEERDER